MELPMRLVCSECGRTVEPSGDHSVGAVLCAACGGVMETGSWERQGADSLSRTPRSLELTPADFTTDSWARVSGRPMPETIGRFRLRELLGGGGFGYVYRAFDARLDRDVALKVLRDERPPPRVVERFFREARAASQLDHPHIVPLHDAGRDEGRCWIAYQFIPGPTLARARDDRALSMRRCVEIVRSLADALDHAHSRGVFHRDVKPANVLIDPAGRPRLTDFGLARRIDYDQTMTQDGAILGTPAYMSPEVAAGKGHLADARSDLYSLGVILYELLCGRRPSDLPSGAPPWRASIVSPVRSPRTWDRRIPRALNRICLRSLASDPEARYPNSRCLVDDLDQWLRGRERHWLLAQTGMLAALLVAGIAARELADYVGRARTMPVASPIASAGPRVEDLQGPPMHQALATPLASPPALEEPQPEAFIGNADPRSRTFHRASCQSVTMMKPHNQVSLISLTEALSRGFKPHAQCVKVLETNDSAPAQGEE